MGLWSFDEMIGTTGATIADTGDGTPKVPLTVSIGTVTFSGGQMTPNGTVVIASAPAPYFNAAVMATRAVTLEAWVMAGVADQGSAANPALIAGLSASINSRNISIMQAGKRWLARVRTTPDGVMTDANGKPDLLSSKDLTPGVMTHLVVVDDATHRVLYVNGSADAVDPKPGPPFAWDSSYKMVLGNETSQNRPWMGTFALIAIYKQALSDTQIQTNYQAGPNAN